MLQTWKLVAETMRDNKPDDRHTAQFILWTTIVRGLARSLKRAEEFESREFYRVCGVASPPSD